MDWSADLEKDEIVRWKGRPSPRCYTFRNWRHSLFGMLLLPLTGYWQAIGWSLGKEYSALWPMVLPFPFFLAASYLAIGHLLLSRVAWEKIFYALTDRRVLVSRGVFRRQLKFMPLEEIAGFRVKPHGRDLATVSIRGHDSSRVLGLSCLEHPRILTSLLEEVVQSNGIIANQKTSMERRKGGKSFDQNPVENRISRI